MILDDVFLFLKAEGLTRTHATFSTDYLGHSARYYDYLRCSGATPSLRALITLSVRLHDASRSAESRPTRPAKLVELADKIMRQAIKLCR